MPRIKYDPKHDNKLTTSESLRRDPKDARQYANMQGGVNKQIAATEVHSVRLR